MDTGLGDVFVGNAFKNLMLLLALIFMSWPSHAIDVAATTAALRMRNSITGGTMPLSDPLFQQMVAAATAGDLVGAARIAAGSKYFAGYLARRLAKQMQNPSLDATDIPDSDATTFLVAHFTGAGGTTPRISNIFSENATYLVFNSQGEAVHAGDLSENEKMTIDWTNMIRMGGQQDGNGFYIPVKHVGGYATLSDRNNDGSLALYGATAGTNLRYIEAIWEIATGLTLTDVSSSAVSASATPRFIPVYDPSFFQGQGQPACLSCHGGGMSSVNHGYATVANTFDVTGNGFTFVQNITTNTMKSLGSDPGSRARNQACNLSRTPTPVCNPESPDVDPNQGWDLSPVWPRTGVLRTMGWMAPLQGQGLQSLGYSITQSWIVYQFLTQRVIGELCPLGTFTAAEINRIASMANAWGDPAGTDDIRTIVANVAASPGCQ